MSASITESRILNDIGFSNAVVLLSFFTTEDAMELMLICSAFLRWVRSFRWKDTTTPVTHLGMWRRQFPNAVGCRISSIARPTDVDFANLAGIHTLDVSGCRLTDAAFAHLRVNSQSIHTLNMSYCNQETITDAAFAHLAGIHTLNMDRCSQKTITDAAFAHLAGIHTLSMSRCWQETITDAAFAHLAGIHTLNMSCCQQETITDAAFAHLAGVHKLVMAGCIQKTITNAAFPHLVGIQELNIHGRSIRSTVWSDEFASLKGVKWSVDEP